MKSMNSCNVYLWIIRIIHISFRRNIFRSSRPITFLMFLKCVVVETQIIKHEKLHHIEKDMRKIVEMNEPRNFKERKNLVRY